MLGHSSKSDCRLQYLLSLVPKTFMHGHERICALHQFVGVTGTRQQYEVSHSCNTQKTVGPIEPHFGEQGTKTSNGLHNRRWNFWIQIFKTKLSEGGWTAIEKSRPEHGHKLTYLCDLLSTGNSCWRRFRMTWKTIEGYVVVNFETASSGSFRRDIKKLISLRRRRRRKRTSAIG